MSTDSERKRRRPRKPNGDYVPRAGRLKGWIYFIQAGEDGPIKIGFAKKPEARLSDLQVGNHAELRLIGRIRGSFFQEHVLHSYFEAFRLRAEWFAPAPALLDFIAHPKLPSEVMWPDRKAEITHCDNCLEPLSPDDRVSDDVLCGICRCRFEDGELPEAESGAYTAGL